jgi:hypothetical protein
MKKLPDDDRPDEVKYKEMFDTWVNVFKLYDRPDQEARLFGVFLSMGSPLFCAFDNVYSAILHLTNKDSGVGKTTIQLMANSVWGNPSKDSLFSLKDTKNAYPHYVGVLNNIVFCIDELTNIDPQRCSDFAFDITQGRGKNRMMANENALRDNHTSWHTPTITSGNNSLLQVMTHFKLVADGEGMRVIEMPVYRDEELQSTKYKTITDKAFGVDLINSYGVIGDVLLKYYVANAAECFVGIKAVQVEFDARAGLTSKERYYSSMFATVVYAARISKTLGIHNVDLNAFESWCEGFVREYLRVQKVNVLSLTDQFKEYLHEMSPNTIVTTTIGGELNIVYGGGYSGIHVRSEKDFGNIYVAQGNFKQWCTKQQVPYNTIVEHLKNNFGAVIGRYKIDVTSNVAVTGIKINSTLLSEATN